MAITQVSKIEVRSGIAAELPQLSLGEFGFATDSNQLFIGTNYGNVAGPVPLNVEILTQYSPIASNSVPSTATSPGFQGQIAYDATHLYVCVAANVWVRADLATW